MRRVLPCGDSALLVELDDLDQVMAFDAALRAAPLHGIEDVVPAARTVLVRFDPAHVRAAAVVEHVERLDATVRTASEVAAPGGPSPIEIAVRYDGEDLEEVAALLGVAVGDVIERHVAGTYRVAFIGFAPGFAYLVGGDDLSVPRRSTPRTTVAAGSVALAGGYCGIYPRSMPGGWQVIGHTEQPVWDPALARPALLHPGACVRFRVDVTEHPLPKEHR